MNAKTNADIYQAVTDRMVAALDAGTVPWTQPWTNAGAPRSLSSRRPYRGVNVLLLGMTAAERGYTSPWWGTAKQINLLGGHIRKGQNRDNGCGGTTVLLWKTASKRVADDDRPGETRNQRILLAREFNVFNAEQTEGLPARFFPKPGAPVDEIADPQGVLDAYLARDGSPSLAYDGGDGAYYHPATDAIHLPPLATYVSAQARYGVAFHEAGHSTGHPSRLDREGIAHIDHFGSGRYAREELVAEMSAALLAAVTGINTAEIFDNSAAYLANWASALKRDPHLIVTAASQAFAAADFVRGIKSEYADEGADTNVSANNELAVAA
jgi:antirestriction protein ArdC